MARLPARTIVSRGLLAAVLAAIGNAALVAVADALSVAPNLEHLVYSRVVFFTVAGVLAATGVYALIASRRADPDSLFVRVAAVALVVSLVPDVGPGSTSRRRRPLASPLSRQCTSSPPSLPYTSSCAASATASEAVLDDHPSRFDVTVLGLGGNSSADDRCGGYTTVEIDATANTATAVN